MPSVYSITIRSVKTYHGDWVWDMFKPLVADKVCVIGLGALIGYLYVSERIWPRHHRHSRFDCCQEFARDRLPGHGFRWEISSRRCLGVQLRSRSTFDPTLWAPIVVIHQELIPILPLPQATCSNSPKHFVYRPDSKLPSLADLNVVRVYRFPPMPR